MAIKTFFAVGGQSIFDVCLNTYGDIGLMSKLLTDNNVVNIDQLVSSRQPFLYDDTLVVDLGTNQRFAQSGVFYSTDVSKLGSVYYTISGQVQGNNTTPAPVNNNTQTAVTYSQVNSTFFTSGADGTTSMTLLDKDGASMIGFDIVEITLEIKNLKPSQFLWNKATGVLTLLGGLTIDLNQTLFILYRQLITA